jgi:hypothetical protein
MHSFKVPCSGLMLFQCPLTSDSGKLLVTWSHKKAPTDEVDSLVLDGWIHREGVKVQSGLPSPQAMHAGSMYRGMQSLRPCSFTTQKDWLRNDRPRS